MRVREQLGKRKLINARQDKEAQDMDLYPVLCFTPIKGTSRGKRINLVVRLLVLTTGGAFAVNTYRYTGVFFEAGTEIIWVG